MATTKVAGPKTTKAAKKTPARAPAKQAASKPAAGQGAGRAVSAKASTAKATTSAGTARKASTAAALAKKAPVTKTATPRVSAVKPARVRAPVTKAAAKPVSTAAASTGKSRRISPEQALANTRGLLDAKRDHDRQPHSWQTLGPTQSHPGSDGFQSPSAMDKAEELHAAESHLTPIQGSISTRDRHQQGKRDAR